MAAAQFLHGVEVIEIDDGPRPVRVVRSSVIGIIGTAPNADATVFPLNTPVLIAGSRGKASSLDTSAGQTGEGTLPNAVDLILDQIGAAIIVVRVEEGEDDAETLANILGGYENGQPLGVHVFTGAKSVVGQQPRILIAPGFTSERPQGVVGHGAITGGNSGANGTFPLAFTGGTGSGAEGTFTVAGGALTAITITKGGRYSVAPTFSFAASAGLAGAAASVTLGVTSNAVVAELIGIAERLRAVIIADGPNTTNEAALQYAEDFGSRRVYVVDPAVKVARGANVVVEPASPAVAGLIAKIDNDRGFWWSPSNQNINGIVGIARPIDFTLGDANSAANLLNEGNVATIIYEDGYRLWGNRTVSSDAKFAFLNIVRLNDIVADSILAAHLWAVDRGITKTYFDDVSESVNAFLRSLKAQGAISGGICFPDADLNSAASIQEGKVWFNVDLSGVYPAEHVIFRMRLTGDYLEDLV
ncbi:phage tail sheath subtilisin-like domain-containing protein [Rhizobium sp. 1AS11]|uniref:phage tail sheath subtilisin-like domain-containing protein n=1 Tax=Rhizobium acaciae TaxID=2989736 RepID=UPI0022236F0D|nr:phage tail sheath subtilisin-like domain-containing protein [Rhizobium acaciae]MCW1412215.1 phage tail sheath subtilisin-like domain-containing protein [Rhizobium acaciae]MCW1744230.1 phage tail sheath subtilisin-like domain-containing protein [Rhizobium acaciae]